MSTFIYKRLLPVDLLEVANDQGGDTTITEAIAAMQENKSLTHDCPNCAVGGVSTGYVDILDPPIKVVCPICGGYLKTQEEYIPNPKNIYQFIPFTAILGDNTVVAGHTIPLSNAIAGGAWTSNHPNYASVNSSTGIVTGVSAGVATITYTVTSNCDQYTVTKDITVTAAP